jgi:hypothetical protein
LGEACEVGGDGVVAGGSEAVVGFPHTRQGADEVAAASACLELTARVRLAEPHRDAVLGHAPRLDQVADAVAFLASDRAGGITGTRINVTCGLVPG